ncbi:GNAT family N-acetyltransferase [Gorillibacterium sp. sgz5001074]|uniref:GNAT family N-acetyltransferase n=1 Tax=Gorillibacterium sp. sgz5001074 TaxID=3446695 RepID=UPI003F66902D
MTYCIRPMKVPGDYEGVARVLSSWQADPVRPEVLVEEDRKIPEKGNLWNDNGKLGGHDRRRWVAVSEESGEIVGFGGVFRAPWNAPGELWHSVIVLPEHRHQGIGRTLYGCIEQWATEIGASRLVQQVKENDPEAIRFAENRSFTEERRMFESKLDLTAYQPDPDLEGILDGLENVGISFFTLADIPGEESERKLYELCKKTHPDIPGYDGSFPDFPRWREWTLEGPGVSPDNALIAADGDRFVGLVHLVWNEESRSMYHEYTCTDREYRGRRIALALKLLGIRTAIRQGARHLRTHNDSMNAPMLRINRDVIGFVAEPGLCRMVKDLEGILSEKT